MKKKLFLSLALVFVLSGCGLTGQNEEQLTIEEAKIKTKDFIVNNLVDPTYNVEIINATEEYGLYKIEVLVESSDLGTQTIESYLTKDGSKFFPEAINIEEFEQQQQANLNEDEDFQPEEMSVNEQAQAMWPQAENLLNQLGEQVGEEDRQNIEQKTQELKDLSESGEATDDELMNKMMELQQAVQPIIETQMNQEEGQVPNASDQGGQVEIQPVP